MSTTADVVLAAGPSVVALAAIGSAVLQQRRAIRHERSLADLAAVRAVLDDAAIALHHADAVVVDRLYDLSDALLTYDAAMSELGSLRERLAVRFGRDHALTQSVSDALKALHGVGVTTANPAMRDAPPPYLRDEPPAPDADEESWREVWRTAERAGAEFTAAQGRFNRAAVASAGVRLP